MTNKFNIHWQIVRVNARDIKCTTEKILYVMHFLNDNKNIYNYDRVMNWLKMTGFGYQGKEREKFENAVATLEQKRERYESPKDMDNDLSKIESYDDLNRVYKDLLRRKYDFMINKEPKDHTEFMKILGDELRLRDSWKS